MSQVLKREKVIDLPLWEKIPSMYYKRQADINSAPFSSQNGVSYCQDMRNDDSRNPFIYQYSANLTNISYRDQNTGAIEVFNNTGLNTSNNTKMVYMASKGHSGTIAAGATTTSIPLTTAFPISIARNFLSCKGDHRGWKIRIIGKSVGKVEERFIIANTGETTTPTLTLDTPLSFTPTNTDEFEILSGKIYMIGGTTPSFRSLDILTGQQAALSTTNLVSVSAHFVAVGLDELYVPYNKNPNQGFFGNITASAAAATTITSGNSFEDAAIRLNEATGLQVRIVEDLVNPTAVGQRRTIASNTAGPNPVYTVSSAWTVTPSSSAKFVIENNSDYLHVVNSAGALIRYSISGNAWTVITGTYNSPSPSSEYSSMPIFGLAYSDIVSAGYNLNEFLVLASERRIYRTPINGTPVLTYTQYEYNTLDNFALLGVLSGQSYDPVNNQGRFHYIRSVKGIFRFDLVCRRFNPIPVPIGTEKMYKITTYATATSAINGEDFCVGNYVDDEGNKLTILYMDMTSNTASIAQLYDLNSYRLLVDF